MIRSPEQQFAFAKRLPIQELAKVLQGQSDVVDMSIAEMVLRQKTQAQKAMQGMQAQAVAQQPKVVEKDLAEAKQVMQPRMEQGLASMPVGGIGEIGNYTGAGGGIVAFDDGGEVQRFQGQGPSFVQSASSPFGRDIQAFSEAGRRSMLETTPGMVGAYDRPLISPEEYERMRLIQLLNQKFGAQGSLIQGYFMEQSPEQRAQTKNIVNKLPSMSLAELRSLAGTTGAAIPTASTTPQTTGQRFVGSDVQGSGADVRKSDAEKGGPNAPSMPAQTPPYIPKNLRMSEIAPAPIELPSMGQPNYTVLRTDAENIASTLMGQRPVALSTEQQFQTVKDIYSRAGVDLNLFKNQIAELEKEKGDTKLDRKEMANLRLLEAGLGILGGESPYGFVNIGKGATPALKGLQEDIKDLKKLERDRKKEIRSLEVAQNQLAAGVGKDVSERIDKAQLRLDNYDKEAREIRGNIFNTLTNSDNQRRVAEYNAKVQFGIATLPGSTERILERSMRDPAYAAKYKELFGRATDSMADVVEYYAKNPLALDRLRDSKDPQDVALYNSIKARIAGMSVPPASGRPTGTVRD